jgi:hypothetical protein
VLAFARNAAPVGIGDHVVLTQMRASIAPLVPHDVTRPLAIYRQLALVEAKGVIVEILVQKALTKISRKSDHMIVDQDIMLFS